jgi:nucleoid-associated protein YgaU
LRDAGRETRIILAVGLSVVILVGTLVVNKLRPRGKQPSTPPKTAVAARKATPVTALPGRGARPPDAEAKAEPSPGSLVMRSDVTPPPPPPANVEIELDGEGSGEEAASAPSPAAPDELELAGESGPDSIEPPVPLTEDVADIASPLPEAIESPLPSAPVPDEDPSVGSPSAQPVAPAPLLDESAAASPSTTPPGEFQSPGTATSKADDPQADPGPMRTPTDGTSEPHAGEVSPPVAESTAIPSLTPAPSVATQDADTGGLIPLPNAGRVDIPVERPLGEPRRAIPAPAARGSRSAAAIPSDRVEPVRHVVQKGENFATIARLYYGSMRFYKALWKANEDVATAPEKLYVGTTIRVPPPELLDPSLIEPPRAEPRAVAAKSVRKDEQAHRAGQDAGTLVRLPHGKVGRSSPGGDPIEARPPSRSHVVRDRETLRSIARDHLGDPRRETEIRDLNIQVLGDNSEIRPGMRLRLPGDATSDTVVR